MRGTTLIDWPCDQPTLLPTIIGCPVNAGLAEVATYQMTGFTIQLKSELRRCSFDRGFQSATPIPWRTIKRVLFSVIA
ncbi:MAG TPA: hypothetical protein VFK30_03745 [Anaerolineae bacterium]|nr:hypothetical protein [Anaerolineae bacterium]